MSGDKPGFIASLDIGTTTLRCQIIDQRTNCIGSSFKKVKLHYPDDNSVEIDPKDLWKDVLDVMKNALTAATLSIKDTKSLAISTQRSTFITWSRASGKPFHNFITWKDLRAVDLIQQVNKSWKIWALRFASYLAHLVTRHTKFGIVSKLKFTSNHVTIRLLHQLQTNKDMQGALAKGDLMFGTLDTWLVYKFTGGSTYVTDISNACATGMYDPFSLRWSFIPKYLNIPVEILPPVVDNDYDFGGTCSELFGVSVPIGAVMADQSASMFGTCSFEENDVKLTLGTGVFMDVNTGKAVQGSLNGLYPLVGWRFDKDVIAYLVEVPCSDAGSLIEWMLAVGLIDSPQESSDVANQLEDTQGVYFIPAFSGLGPPINNETASSGFIGIQPNTKKKHMVRAVLESIAYRTTLAYNLLRKETGRSFDCIKVDGGVSKNDFICQMLADLMNVEVRRMPSEMSALGAAFVAGIKCGLWKSKDDLASIQKDFQIFRPATCKEKLENVQRHLEHWKMAAKRFMSWYDSQ